MPSSSLACEADDQYGMRWAEPCAAVFLSLIPTSVNEKRPGHVSPPPNTGKQFFHALSFFS
jgi:hypothetical protein